MSPVPHHRTSAARVKVMAAGVMSVPTRGVLLRPCPKCDARPGEKCRVWVVREGKRLYVARVRVKSHPERGRTS